MGHAERSCLIGLRLADATERRSSLVYALLLKDAGCSTTSEVFGSDELHVKRESRLVDPKRPAQSLRYLSRTIAPGAPLRTRARHLRDVARLAGTHHERLDGSGYPDCLAAADLDVPDRILQVADVADVAEALSAERPYRAALPVDEVLSIMARDAGSKLDAGAFAALEAWLPGRDATFARAA
jgi:hypothetical protein